MGVNLEGDAILGDIIADSDDGEVEIDSGGSLTQAPGTSIRGDELDIQAKGDVDVDVYVNNVEINAGGITVGTYYYRGLTRLAMGEFENAAVDFTEALKWEEDKDSCIFNRGVCYAALGENEKAREDLMHIAENAADASLAASAQELLVTFQE